MLVIHSRGDTFIPVADAWAIAGSARADLWMTESEGRLSSYRHDPAAYTERVVGFLSRHVLAITPLHDGVLADTAALAA